MHTPEPYQVVKAFNNSVLLALQNGKERILIAKGIGFGRQVGDYLAADTPCEKIFTIDDAENSGRLRQLLGEISDALFITCENIIHMISRELGEELNEKIHINLVDHIAFMLKRLQSGDEISNPFQTEIEVLYKREFELARQAVSMLEEDTKLQIPDGEIGFIAMHIHSARRSGQISQTIKCAFLANTIVDFLEEELQLEIDRQSLTYARFITHVRFTVERLLTNVPIQNELLATIKRKYKASFALAKQVGALIADELAMPAIPDDEVGYLTLHIEKLRTHQ
jgi:transcriptional antiterminator